MGDKRNVTEFGYVSQKETDHHGDQDVGGRKILIWMLEKEEGVERTGFTGLN
jgi:hypothetical protein